MLDDRAKKLLKALVERYIADGQPVGSRTLSRASGLDLSPATIRNVMADLEDLGFIASPHTSAGRVPTARGYRLFRRHHADHARLRPRIGDCGNGARTAAPHQPQRVIAQAATLLSSLSHFVGVVIAPRKADVFHHIEFLRLGDKRVLVILVAPTAMCRTASSFTARDLHQPELIEATNYLNAHYAGLTIEEVRERLKGEIEALRGEIAALMEAAVRAGEEMANATSTSSSPATQPARRAGLRQRHDQPAPAVRRLEHKTELMRLLDVSSRAEGVRIYIGRRKPGRALRRTLGRDGAVRVDGRIVGTLA